MLKAMLPNADMSKMVGRQPILLLLRSDTKVRYTIELLAKLFPGRDLEQLFTNAPGE